MDLSLYQIDILKEVRGQILHQLFANNYSGGETRAYLDTVKIIDEKVEEINKALDTAIRHDIGLQSAEEIAEEINTDNLILQYNRRIGNFDE